MAMEGTLQIVDEALEITGFDGPVPCDERGIAT
jgi:hypothetical protein